jgi:3-oxoacyl-[acyl-carrier protein] reductase
VGKLDGQHALVTGAGSGLGRAIAAALAAEGARVAVADLDGARAERTNGELGGRGFALVGDVADAASVRAWFDETLRRFGSLEILVNNAGYVDAKPELQERGRLIADEVMSGRGQQTPLDATATLRDAEWRRMLAVHLDGTFFCTRVALRAMTAQRYGRIVNMASIAGLTGIASVPHYSAAKGGIIAFTKAVAREVARLGIAVNAIAPGYIETPLLDAIDAFGRAMLAAAVPMGRFGRPEEVVPIALLLVDPASAFLTGQVVSPNGGEVM